MNQDSIIVYRNPIEKQFWESGFSSDIILFTFVVLGVLVMMVGLSEMFKIGSKYQTKFVLGGTAIVSLLLLVLPKYF